jgi:hypothetical protein
MKKQIDLRKRCAESDKICAYMKIGYRAIDDWNELMPVVQKVADDILGLHDGSYCDADIMWEHGFVEVIYRDVAYVRNIVCRTIDWLLKQSITEVHGCLYRLTVENLYNHKELRDALANEQIHHILNDAYVWIEDGGEGQVFSFVDDIWTEGGKVVKGYSADFCNEFIKARKKLEMITKLYDCAGDNVEPKIILKS